MSEDGPKDVAMGLWPEVSAIPGAQLTLSLLAPRYRLAVATNAVVSGRDLVLRALERVGLGAYFSDVFCFAEIGARKDSEAFWDAVLARLRMRSSELAMVGDSLEQDVLGPRRFGIASVWFNEDARAPAAPPGIPTIHRLPELVPLLERRAARPEAP
jgi:FMN phosphatase YigB (HAD superfamily)